MPVRHVVASAVQRLVRDRSFTLRIVAIFLLGMGANTVMFGVVDRLLLRPPAHIGRADGVRRVVVERRVPSTNRLAPDATTSYPVMEDLRAVPGIAGVAAYLGSSAILGRHEAAGSINMLQVTGDYFDVLDARVERGRVLAAADDEAGADPVMVISDRLWRGRFGGRDVLGQAMDLGGQSYTIVGIAPPGFTGADPGAVDAWVPLHVEMNSPMFLDNRGFQIFRMVVRIEPGQDAVAVASRATAAYRRGESVAAGSVATDSRVILASIIAARGPLASGESRVARWLFAVSLLVLVIACANVANLLLVRSVRRQAETGIRMALGVSRGRLIAESVLDGMLPAALGAGAALLAAEWVGGFIQKLLLPDGLVGGPMVDGRLVLFLGGLTLLVGCGAGLLPAMYSCGYDVRRLLRASEVRVTGSGRARAGLVVFQTGLSLVLLVAATLFLRSLHEVRATDFGFEPDGLLLARPILDDDRDSNGERDRYFSDVARQIATIPGVTAVATAGGTTPFSAQIFNDLVGQDQVTGSRWVFMSVASPGYLDALGIDLIAGRGFEDTDIAGGGVVAVINRTMAATVWPGGDAVGRCFQLDAGEDSPACIRVVGVVEDTHRRNLEESPFMQAYFPAAQDPIGIGADVLYVRTAGDPRDVAPAVRRAMVGVIPRLRFAQVDAVPDLIDPLAHAWEVGASLFTLFGALALLVAGFGLYSLLSFEVEGRRRELAIRSALGASRAGILRDIVARGLVLAGAGLGVGLAVAAIAAPRVADLLYHTRPFDPGALAIAVVALLSATILASLVPALQALRTDPARSLRPE